MYELCALKYVHSVLVVFQDDELFMTGRLFGAYDVITTQFVLPSIR
jgi:hypothetical protein